MIRKLAEELTRLTNVDVEVYSSTTIWFTDTVGAAIRINLSGSKAYMGLSCTFGADLCDPDSISKLVEVIKLCSKNATCVDCKWKGMGG